MKGFHRTLLAVVIAVPAASALGAAKTKEAQPKKQMLSCTFHSLVERGKTMNVKYEIDEAKQQVDGQPATITDDLITQQTPPDILVGINRYTGAAEVHGGGYKLMEGTCEAARQRF